MNRAKLFRELKAIAPYAVWARRARINRVTLAKIKAGLPGYTKGPAISRLARLLEDHRAGLWHFIPARRCSDWRWEGRASFEQARIGFEINPGLPPSLSLTP